MGSERSDMVHYVSLPPLNVFKSEFTGETLSWRPILVYPRHVLELFCPLLQLLSRLLFVERQGSFLGVIHPLVVICMMTNGVDSA
jgi:hypothetical protein